MRDARAWVERLRKEAEECRLISKLATSAEKRETFARLAEAADKNADDLMMFMASGRLSESDQE
ncbi:MAG: hypothetical protein WBA29_03760 [Xanthobacteraceae bacterium]